MSKFVQVTDPAHPHYREYGTLIPEDTIMNGMMTRVNLDNCAHGQEGCYVLSKQYEVVDE